MSALSTPKGPSTPLTPSTPRIKEEWAERFGMQESFSTGEPLAWLQGKRVGDYKRLWWFDHGTRWTKDGKPFMIVGQPYKLEVNNLEELGQLRTEGFDVWCGAYPSWHNPGRVLSVIVAVRGALTVEP